MAFIQLVRKYFIINKSTRPQKTELGVMLEQSNKASSILLQNRLVKVMATFDKALNQVTKDDVFYVDY